MIFNVKIFRNHLQLESSTKGTIWTNNYQIPPDYKTKLLITFRFDSIPKIKFSTWYIITGRIPTKGNPNKRKENSREINDYSLFYASHLEEINHLSMQCFLLIRSAL